MRNEIPRGVEVLVKKAAVDPAFKKTLLAKRARAADDIALELSPAEAAMLEAVPEEQLRAIISITKVSPGLRPAFLGYAAGVMLAALGAATYAKEPAEPEMRTTGVDAETPPEAETAGTAGETEPTAEVAGVSGMVLDENGQPVSGAIILVRGANRFAITNADGYYVISPVPEGVYNVETSRIGYVNQTQEGVKIVGDIRTNLSFVLTRDPYGSVSGRVFGVDEERLEDVEVIVVGTGLTARTDKNGYYKISAVPEGWHKVKVTCDELRTTSKKDVLVIKNRRTNLSFLLGDEAETAAAAENNAATGTGTVSGLVMCVDGEPLPLENAEVIIVGIGLTGCTDECGYYRISSVPEGTYEIIVTHDIWGTTSQKDVRVITDLGTSVPFYLGLEEVFSNMRRIYEDEEKNKLQLHTRGSRPDLPYIIEGVNEGE